MLRKNQEKGGGKGDAESHSRRGGGRRGAAPRVLGVVHLDAHAVHDLEVLQREVVLEHRVPLLQADPLRSRSCRAGGRRHGAGGAGRGKICQRAARLPRPVGLSTFPPFGPFPDPPCHPFHPSTARPRRAKNVPVCAAMRSLRSPIVSSSLHLTRIFRPRRSSTTTSSMVDSHSARASPRRGPSAGVLGSGVLLLPRFFAALPPSLPSFPRTLSLSPSFPPSLREAALLRSLLKRHTILGIPRETK